MRISCDIHQNAMLRRSWLLLRSAGDPAVLRTSSIAAGASQCAHQIFSRLVVIADFTAKWVVRLVQSHFSWRPLAWLSFRASRSTAAVLQSLLSLVSSKDELSVYPQ